jgi:hypothetical protein
VSSSNFGQTEFKESLLKAHFCRYSSVLEVIGRSFNFEKDFLHAQGDVFEERA